MATSNYLGFPVTYESSPGVMTSVGPDVPVIIYDVDTDTDIATVTTDGGGNIAASSCETPEGSEIRFRVESFEGRAFSTAQITT